MIYELRILLGYQMLARKASQEFYRQKLLRYHLPNF